VEAGAVASCPMSEVDLAALADAGAFVSHEHQSHLAEIVRGDGWRIDAAGSAFVFTDMEGRERSVRAHFVGTSSPDDRTWLWGWQNINGFPRSFVKQSERVRSLGERYAIREFTTATLPLDEALPATLLKAVKAVTGVTAHFSAATGNGGTRAWLLLDDPSLALPAPTVARAVAVLTSALAAGGPADHRRALVAWTQQRGVGLTHVDDAVDELTLTDGALQVRFDVADRIAGLGKRLRTAQEPPAAPEQPEQPEQPAEPPRDRRWAPPTEPVSQPSAPAEPEPEPEEPRRGLLQRLLGL
jgi:hypothetical protein